MTIYHIYGLFNEEHTGTYIGHTKDLAKRLSVHKNDAKTRNSKVYKYMREVQGEWKIEVLETHECSKKYAIERERYYKELMGDLNTEVPGRTHAEYHLDNKEKYVKNTKTWRENNPEKVKAKYAKNKLNRFTCECGVNLRYSDKSKHEKTKKHVAYKNKE